MTEIIVAALALCGTLIGSFGGVLASNKLVVWRIEQLEKKVDKHNNVIERVFKLETHQEVIDEEIEHLRSYHD
mgnify:CR=1 FL=1